MVANMLRPLATTAAPASASELCASSCFVSKQLKRYKVRDAILSRRKQWQSTFASSHQRAIVPAISKPLALIRHVSVPVTPPRTYSTVVLPKTTPYDHLTVGVPTEIFPGERRVSLTPANVALLKKKGFKQVLVERGAGTSADFLDAAYEAAGATLVTGPKDVWSNADIILKVRGPGLGEVDCMKEGQTIISLLQPAQNKELVEKIAARKATSFAMDMIPRISRAQVFDALSSMANIAGYKAVLEASNVFGRFLTGQVTAAGKIPPLQGSGYRCRRRWLECHRYCSSHGSHCPWLRHPICCS
ncbi:hypothetical protein FSOLCH5_007589 [Fusarium solani]